MSGFLGFVVCAGCGESFPVRTPGALKRSKWCSERCRKAQYSTPCIDCGAPTNGSDGHGARAPKRCKRCSSKEFVARNRERSVEHRALVERLWAEGKTSREIAAVVGTGGSDPGHYISAMRQNGYDLPHRRTPEQLARMAIGSRERMAKARAARRPRTTA